MLENLSAGVMRLAALSALAGAADMLLGDSTLKRGVQLAAGLAAAAELCGLFAFWTAL